MEIRSARTASRAGAFHTLSPQFSKDQLLGKARSVDWGWFKPFFTLRKHLLSGSSMVHLKGPVLTEIEDFWHCKCRLEQEPFAPEVLKDCLNYKVGKIKNKKYIYTRGRQSPHN